jgi:predicted ester cyclase
LQLESIAVEGSVVAVRYTETGKSQESFREAELTGKTFKVTAMEWFSIRDGKIQEWRGARDSAAIVRQLK